MILRIILFMTLILSCAGSTKENLYDNNSFIIWAHSDVQPRSPGEKSYYENAVNDITAILKRIDIALFAGDIVQHSDFEETYRWFLETRGKAPVHEWHEIAGNHDWRAIDLYRKHVRKDLHYSVKKGNLLILMMSNESPGRQTYISDVTFRWWRNLVINNQDKIIITVTHGALEGSGITASYLDRLIIKDSKRFTETLKKYRVDLWLSGHSHLPGWIPNMQKINKDYGNTVFIDMGAIREDFMTDSESLLIIFRDGSSYAIIKRRNHSSCKYINGDFIFQLPHPFTLN
jgi:predicted phosphodiesterase